MLLTLIQELIYVTLAKQPSPSSIIEVRTYRPADRQTDRQTDILPSVYLWEGLPYRRMGEIVLEMVYGRIIIIFCEYIQFQKNNRKKKNIRYD